jgi:4-amino-4-deoxy-L-arabinose transferase-like glycosyltransferase
VDGRGAIVLVLLVVLCVPFLIALGSFGLIDPAEPRFAEGARNLLEEDADPIVPEFNGEPRFAVPVLTYWAIAGSYLLFGIGEGAARVPSALAGIAVILLVFDLGRRLVDRTTGLLVAAVAATSVLHLLVSRLAVPDALLVLSVTLSIHAHVIARQDPSRRWGPTLLLGFALALGMATKGPVGVFVPGLVILVEAGVRQGFHIALLLAAVLATGFLVAAEAFAPALLLAQGMFVVSVTGLGARLLRREPETLGMPIGASALLAVVGFILLLMHRAEGELPWKLFLLAAAGGFLLLLCLVFRREPRTAVPTLAGLLLVLGIGFYWYGALLLPLRQDGLDLHFLSKTAGRFTVQEGALQRPAWFYVPILLGGFLPWSLAAVPAAIHAVRRETGLARSLPITWIVATLLLFSAMRDKAPAFLVPIAPGVALLVGIWLRRGIQGAVPDFRRWLLALGLAMPVLAAVSGFVLPESFLPGGVAAGLTGAAILSVSALGAVVALRRPKTGLVVLVLGLAVALAYAGWTEGRKVAERNSRRALAPILAQEGRWVIAYPRLGEGLVAYGRRVSWHWEAHPSEFVCVMEDLRWVARALAGEEPAVVWLPKEDWPELRAMLARAGADEPRVLFEEASHILVANSKPEPAPIR